MIPIGKLDLSSGEFFPLEETDFQNSGAPQAAGIDYVGYQEFMSIMKGYVRPMEQVRRKELHSFLSHYGDVTPSYLGYLNSSYSYLMIGGGVLCYNVLPSMAAGNTYGVGHVVEFGDFTWPQSFYLLYSLESTLEEIQYGKLHIGNAYNGVELYDHYSNLIKMPNPKDTGTATQFKYNFYSNSSGTITVKAITYTFDYSESKDFYLSHSAAANSSEEPKNYKIQIEAAATDQVLAQTIAFVRNAVKSAVTSLSTFFVSR